MNADPEVDLSLKLKTLPDSPGVYQFRNNKGVILYIGKAKNLRNRVRTYFQSPRNLDPKTGRLMVQVTDFDLFVTDSDIEALILEANLVHEHAPRYNVRLKDDKHFPYIKVTTNEPFPRILIVRWVENDGASYFGPYTSTKMMRKTVEYLRRLFNIRTCNLVIPHPQGKPYKVCLQYHIKRCGGPCEGLQSQEEYRALSNSVVMALSGKAKTLIDGLKNEMNVAAENTDYETAALMRDRIQGLESMMIKQNVDIGERIDTDIIALAREKDLGLAVVMQIREGVLLGRQDFQLAAQQDDMDEAVLETFIEQYYNNQPNLPDEIFVPGELTNQQLIEKWLTSVRKRRVKLITPKQGRKVKLVDLAAANARLLLDELLIQKRSQKERTSKMVVALKDDLNLSQSPMRIVCFDISNTGETDAVGSCVMFENGIPKKSGYRHFRIKGVKGQDDFKMMREIVGRYFHRLKEEKQLPPDLVVIDGGKGQLSAAHTELKSLGFDTQPIIGLAKRLEEVFVPGQQDSLTISKSSPGLILLKRVRDEAHRFAITFNRKVRSKRTITSALDKIPGVGPAKRDLLLKTFGSVERIRQADLEQIISVKGMTKTIAEAIKQKLATS